MEGEEDAAYQKQLEDALIELEGETDDDSEDQP